MKEIELENKRNENKLINTVAKQNDNLNYILQNIINWSIDKGIKYLFPNLIGDKIVKIKNSILNSNTQEKITSGIQNIINMENKKSSISNKENNDIQKIEEILNDPKTIEMLTEIVEKILNNMDNVKIKDKSIVLKDIHKNLSKDITEQINSINNINNYSKDWYNFFEKENFNSMNKSFNKIKNELKNIAPIEEIIIKTKKIENLHELVKGKGGDFNITKEEMELANKLI